ncbi:3-hydroxy-3-methylglutaryl-coenzyme A (HMG-CoA) reductase isozyme, partial [Dinochytrium kinnereticum]
FAVLVNGTFALLVALFVAKWTKSPITFIQISEAIPFLVVTIGFEKPYMLARAIMEAEGSTVPEKVEKGTLKVGPSLVLDYLVEMSILGVGSFIGISKKYKIFFDFLKGNSGGLKEFSLIAAIILLFDGLFNFTFFLAVLSLKLELKTLRQSGNLKGGAANFSAEQNVKVLDLNSNTIPASACPLRVEGSAKSINVSEEKNEDPMVSRAKLLTIVGFLAMNAYNSAISFSKDGGGGNPLPSGRYEAIINVLKSRPAVDEFGSTL